MFKERLKPIAFQFNATSQEVQTVLYNNEPWIVAQDVCEILGLSNPTRALSSLDEDEKLTLPIVRSGQTRKTNLVNESGLYALIFKSRKPEAKTFRKWVTSEVLPAIRKKGYYFAPQTHHDFIDARAQPYDTQTLNGYQVRVVLLNDVPWYSVNDVHRAIHSATPAGQAAKKLNAVKRLATKIWLFGNTHPAWFTNVTGVELLISGSRILKSSNQLKLSL
jgi:prophage antirepressor-like protein